MNDVPKLLIVNGVRPQFIKTAAFIYELENLLPDYSFNNICIFDTAQHYDKTLRTESATGSVERIVVDYGQNKPDIGIAISQLEYFLSSRCNQFGGVVVFGDANPGVIGAVSCARAGIPIIHVEAGARRDFFELEDINTRIVDTVASVGSCVSVSHRDNLVNENFRGTTLHSGDLAFRYTQKILNEMEYRKFEYFDSSAVLLVTTHRDCNSDENTIKWLTDGIKNWRRPTMWVTHPKNSNLVEKYLPSNCQLIQPKPHPEMLKLIQNVDFVLSDSGGVIRESHHLGKHVLVPNTNGGWPELFDHNVATRITTEDDLKVQLDIAYELSKSPYPITNLFFVEDGIEVFFRVLNEVCGLDI